MIQFNQGKAFIRIKSIYVIQKSEIANFPDDTNLAVTDPITETFEEIRFLPNSGTIAITPQPGNHGTAYNIAIACQLNKNSITTSRELDKYKFKELIAIVEDFDNQKILIGGAAEEQFCKLTFSLSLGSSNIYSISIKGQCADYPPYYTNTITSI